MKRQIDKLRLIYDPESKKFAEAYAIIDGEIVHLEDDSEIRDLIIELKQNNNVKNLTELSNYRLAHTTNEKGREAIEKFKNEYENYSNDYVSSLSLNKENPYDEQEVVIKKEKNNKLKKVLATAGIIITLGAAGLAGCTYAKKHADAKNATAAELETEEKKIEKIEKTEKINPTSWDEYVSEYAESNQKTMLTKAMDSITSNIIDISINNKEYKIALAPAEFVALNYYYNTYNMSNEEMLSIYGTYNLGNYLNKENTSTEENQEKNNHLNNNVHNGLDKLRLAFMNGEIIDFDFEDEVTNNLYKKYGNLMKDYVKGTDKKTAKKAIEDALRNDFLTEEGPQIIKHPSSTVIPQIVLGAMNLLGDPLEEKLNTKLGGVQTNINEDGVKDTYKQNGIVDSSCAPIDEHLEEFDEFRKKLELEKNSNDNHNDMLYLAVIANDKLDQEYYESQYKVSDFDKITKDTYPLKEVLIPLMNEKLSKNFDLADIIDINEFNETIHKETVKELREKQLNNTKPFNPKTNPTGGKKGDVFVESTQKGINISESKVPEAQKQAIKDSVSKKEGIVSDKDDTAKQEEYVEDITPLLTEAYNAGYREIIDSKNKNAPISKKYSENSDQNVVNKYFQGRNDGIKWLEDNEKKLQNGNKTTETKEDGVEKHKDNPNQNGQNNQSTPTEEKQQEVSKPAEPTPTPTPTPIEQPGIGNHEDNPNQKQDSNSTISNTDMNSTISNTNMNNVIDGTLTTDPTGVEDMTIYGDVMEAKASLSYSIANQIDAMLDKMADQNDPINQVESESFTK